MSAVMIHRIDGREGTYEVSIIIIITIGIGIISLVAVRVPTEGRFVGVFKDDQAHNFLLILRLWKEDGDQRVLITAPCFFTVHSIALNWRAVIFRVLFIRGGG